MPPTTPPDRTEAAEYYFTYIDKVPPGDICRVLETQMADTLALLKTVSEERSLGRYAPGKWTMREVVSHVNDTERLFAFRAMWFARGLEGALPSFDQDVAIAAAGAGERTLASHVEEFSTVRAASLTMFRSMPEDAWMRRGTASGYSFTVRALAYITAGHAAHHALLLRERYL